HRGFESLLLRLAELPRVRPSGLTLFRYWSGIGAIPPSGGGCRPVDGEQYERRLPPQTPRHPETRLRPPEAGFTLGRFRLAAWPNRSTSGTTSDSPSTSSTRTPTRTSPAGPVTRSRSVTISPPSSGE